MESGSLGQFNKGKDLYLAHFDLKTDIDDAHAAAAVATMLADKRFTGVSYHAVAGTYGMLWNVLMATENREHRAFYHTGNGIHFLGVYPHSQVVIVHRVDTEKPYQFNQQNFYQMINKVWGAYSGN